jgi:hypothetical protein
MKMGMMRFIIKIGYVCLVVKTMEIEVGNSRKMKENNISSNNCKKQQINKYTWKILIKVILIEEHKAA